MKGFTNPLKANCAGCGEYKDMALYQKEQGGKFYARSHCVPCWSAERNGYQQAYREKYKERLRIYDREKYKTNLPAIKIRAKRHYEKWKKVVFDHYGNVCSCCGETQSRFLTIDHMDDDGAEHRKDVSAGLVLFKWLINNNFPKNFRILCFNCNAGRFHNGGKCPHEAEYKSQSDFKSYNEIRIGI